MTTRTRLAQAPFWSAALTAVFACIVAAQSVDTEFGRRAHKHVEALAALGPRVPDTGADRNAEKYIADQMRRAGLAVTIERFEFDNFRLDSAEVSANTILEAVERVIVDPYGRGLEFRGPPLFVDAANCNGEDLAKRSKGRILIAEHRVPLSRVRLNAGVVVVVSTEAFERLKTAAASDVKVRLRGHVEHVQTSNVIGTVGDDAGPFVMFTAHRDSVENSPGADDNASGIGVLLEVGRTWKEARTAHRARFVALAAEERGFVGAKAYIAAHIGELGRCVLAFNIDSVGADGPRWVDANGGVAGIQAEWTPEVRADVGPGAIWIAVPQFPRASNVPVWLKEAVLNAAKDAGVGLDVGQFSASDHLAFARAGVPATHVSANTDTDHTSQDLPASVSDRALADTGRFALAVGRRVSELRTR